MARDSNPSLQALERELLRGFFATLAEEFDVTTIHWRDEYTVVRFQNAVSSVDEYLNLLASEESTKVRRVVRRLRPDPLTGLSLALERFLMELFSGDLRSSKNWEELLLPIAKIAVTQIIHNLNDTERRAVRKMAKVFMQKDDDEASPSAEDVA